MRPIEDNERNTHYKRGREKKRRRRRRSQTKIEWRWCTGQHTHTPKHHNRRHELGMRQKLAIIDQSADRQQTADHWLLLFSLGDTDCQLTGGLTTLHWPAQVWHQSSGAHESDHKERVLSARVSRVDANDHLIEQRWWWWRWRWRWWRRCHSGQSVIWSTRTIWWLSDCLSMVSNKAAAAVSCWLEQFVQSNGVIRGSETTVNTAQMYYSFKQPLDDNGSATSQQHLMAKDVMAVMSVQQDKKPFDKKLASVFLTYEWEHYFFKQ